MWELDYKESWVPRHWWFWTVVLEKTLENPLDCKEIQPVHPKRIFIVLNIHWKGWCWSWNSNTLATWCEDPTYWKRPWCWERMRAGGKGDDRGWDGWMASRTQWTWVWVSSGSWWWTEKPGMLQSIGSQRVGHDWATELSNTFFVYSSIDGYVGCFQIWATVSNAVIKMDVQISVPSPVIKFFCVYSQK